MRKTFQIDGYAVNKRGNTVGIHYTMTSTSPETAKSTAQLSEIQLDQAIDVLEQVGDYMRVNNVSPKILSTGDAIRSINTDNASFWHRTK
ncbi:hypothetical protein MRO90_19050 [Escherichia coli]|uniref:hypothetical protein n=1 Tax=Escherichia coli TaxID=562 RepID=UPI002113C728|nr:hypothetical protein [Escherichia coli]MCQ6967823.1 hypothetical protein [Escherichia coli]